METIIKVSPSQLKSTASEFSAEGSSIKSIMDSMMNKVTGLASYWEGDGATTYINRFKQLSDDITRMVNMCTEHATDLQTMADVYSQFDQQASELASGLATDVIV